MLAMIMPFLPLFAEVLRLLINTFRREPEKKVSDDVDAGRERLRKDEELEELKLMRAATIRRLGLDNKKKFNFAITGQTGTGKSSLVNALRGVGLNSEEAARVDFVECTSEMTPYPHPKFSSLIIWDLPGAGSREHPVETYYEDKALHAFDAVLIVTGDRILAVDLEIAKKSKELGKPVVIVRSKVDIQIKDLSKSKNLTMKEAAQEFREAVNANFRRESAAVKLSGVKILMVSSLAFFKPVYSRKHDRSLYCMDEEAMLRFLYDSTTSRFHDPINAACSGASNEVTPEAAISVLNAIGNWSRKIAICLTNNTSYDWSSPCVHFVSGTADYGLPATIPAGTSFLFGARKSICVAGTTGILTYYIERIDLTISLMWSVPFHYIFYDNWWNLKIGEGHIHASYNLFHSLYSSDTAIKGDSNSTTRRLDPFTLEGTMGASSTPILSIALRSSF